MALNIKIIIVDISLAKTAMLVMNGVNLVGSQEQNPNSSFIFADKCFIVY